VRVHDNGIGSNSPGSSGRESITESLSTEVVSLKMASLFDEWLNSFQSTALSNSSVSAIIIPAIVLVAAWLLAIWAYQRQSSVKETSSSRDERNPSKLANASGREDSSASEIESSSPPTDATKDVWADRRQKGIAAASSHGVKTALANNEKPFKSSYYYAHNNPGAKGGYSDGLNMEDFTMNGPRLLSRSGTPLVSQEDRKNPKVDPVATEPASIPPSAKSVKSKPATPEKTTLLIARYLWDDPGDSSGVANIRIEQLPGVPSTEQVSWKDALVSETSAEITGDGGLLVIIRTTSDFDYKLLIPRLYGDVTSVKTIVKPQKRLVVRLYKKKGGLLNTSNFKAWPHPHKKA
jgi:hypothetical protein